MFQLVALWDNIQLTDGGKDFLREGRGCFPASFSSQIDLLNFFHRE